MAKRKIAVFTGNRAEYGLQFPILKAIEAHPSLDYQLLVSGAHLDSNFGNTLAEIREDGFHIDAEIKIEMELDTRVATAHAIGSGIISVSEALEALKPDMLVVYADRFEGFAAVIAASQMNIPTVHIEGGDLTEGGALDDSVRHAMTKLSHIHFTTNQQAFNRVLALGEESWRVHNVGFPAIDMISTGEYASTDEVSSRLGLDLSKPVVLFTQHSITTEYEKSVDQVKPSLVAMRQLASEGVQVILTYPNNDAGGRAIIAELDAIAEEGVENIQVHSSLGRHLYHGVLALAKDFSVRIACVGNSSSGIKESPIFACPTVNIGTRQQGRLRGRNVIDADYGSENVYSAARKCLFDDEFRLNCQNTDNPYYLGDAGKKMAEVLAEVALDQKLIRKAMTLKGETNNGWYR